jgi:hypothetical protein
MRFLLVFVACLALLVSARADMPSAVGRTLQEYPLIPAPVLRRAVSPKFYKTLIISPIDGWVVVRGKLSGTKLFGSRVTQAQPNHANDHLALQRAAELDLAGSFTLDHPNTKDSVLVHLLLFKTADGVLALSFAHIDGPGGDQMQYIGCTRMAVLKNDGRWVEIEGPPELKGKPLAVRQKGERNNYSTAILKLETVQSNSQ